MRSSNNHRHSCKQSLSSGGKIIAKYKNTMTFLKALIKNPRTMGAVLPSSERLAKAMVSHVVLSKNSVVIELGGGTGVITEALLLSGIPHEQIIVVEYSQMLAKNLHERFPKIKIIEGNAEDLVELLQDNHYQISTIISSLPLRSLPEKTVKSILHQIPKLLTVGGKYIQFTYNLKQDPRYYPNHVTPDYSSIIWLNIPPAKIDVFSFH